MLACGNIAGRGTAAPLLLVNRDLHHMNQSILQEHLLLTWGAQKVSQLHTKSGDFVHMHSHDRQQRVRQGGMQAGVA